MGIVGGGEASTASQPATGGRSTRHDRHWLGRLEQEDQRLKKHYGHWMDIVWSLQRESFKLTKLTRTKGFVNFSQYMNDSSSSDRTMSIQRP